MYRQFNHSKGFCRSSKKGLGKGCLGKRHFPAPHSSPQITRRCVVNLPLFFTVSTPSTRYRRADLSSASNQSPVVMVSPIRARLLQLAAADHPGRRRYRLFPLNNPVIVSSAAAQTCIFRQEGLRRQISKVAGRQSCREIFTHRQQMD